ncbi:MAG: HupE/UreJ family protein [Nocardioides sp.]|uniref:HupE/UreJ family protein n=1 Tax=Nocardioides sp. TaxID=35761 RepID=UPI0039E52087
MVSTLPRVGRALAGAAAAMVAALVATIALALPASAHVVPTSSIQLAVTDAAIVATVDIPLEDLEAASGIDLGEGTQSDVDAQADAIEAYLLDHFAPTSDDGAAWTVTEGDLVVSDAGNTATTGIYAQLETTFTLTPPAGSDVEEEGSFDLGYDAVVDRIATHTIIVTVDSDSTDEDFSGAYEVGTVKRNTVTNEVADLHVDLGESGGHTGLADMVALGMQHIREGTDHQLFLLTLLLPAPLLARARRWSGAVGIRAAVRRIATVTLAFALGHSVTLALGALGVPVPQQLVEAAIALSILVAAVHAIRPVFPGREALVAGAFGLVHGLAFSEALRALNLGGVHLVLALLGFNLGIELMQLLVVALVLPPLVLLARTRHYARLRVAAATLTGAAAVAWLVARLGHPNPVATLADGLGELSIPVVAALWLAAAVLRLGGRDRPGLRASSRPSPGPRGGWTRSRRTLAGR